MWHCHRRRENCGTKHISEFLVPKKQSQQLSEKDAPDDQEELLGEAEIWSDCYQNGKVKVGREQCISQRARVRAARNIKGREKSRRNTIPYCPRHYSLYVETLV